MFAMALTMQIDGDDTRTCTVTFHDSVEAARTKIFETMLAYTYAKTIEDFIKDMAATGDLNGIDVDGMTPEDLITWAKVEILGEECELHYEIKEVPST
jgi:hypothetical protein